MHVHEGSPTAAYHEPVMVDEVLAWLAPRNGALLLDGTLGGGGHTKRMLEACPECRVIGVDRDPEAIAEAREALGELVDRVRFLHCRFDEAVEDVEVKDRGLDGALLDLGVLCSLIDRKAEIVRQGIIKLFVYQEKIGYGQMAGPCEIFAARVIHFKCQYRWRIVFPPVKDTCLQRAVNFPLSHGNGRSPNGIYGVDHQLRWHDPYFHSLYVFR